MPLLSLVYDVRECYNFILLHVALLVASLAILAVLLLDLGHSFFRALFRGRSRLSRFRHVYNDNTQQHRRGDAKSKIR